MLSTCSCGIGIFAYLSDFNHAKLPLSLYRFPPDQFGLDFPFDPSSSLLTTFLDAARYYSIVVVDDFKVITSILVHQIDTMSNDQCILNQFPFDPSENPFIVTPHGLLQVPELQPETSVLTLLLVKPYTFQFFRSLSYNCRTVGICHRGIKQHNLLVNAHAPPVNLSYWKHAKALVKQEPTIWDPGICLEIMALTGFIENVEELLLLGYSGKHFLTVYANFMSRVWDPRQPWFFIKTRILWPMENLENLQGFYYHSHAQREVNYVGAMDRAWYDALDFAHGEIAGACHQVHFAHLEVNVTTPRLSMPLLARFLDLNLEDKVLIRDRSIVMNHPQPTLAVIGLRRNNKVKRLS
ncbi:uncharacterized protein LOC132611265 [Lycium barbarum]|uniref:uncharacterized protein LOC132611265 n=1 Tax=Lycium barbarum TaxID=112863 RepID=UPI00293F0C20|nr:uncharacterized protein LOC132611265 [Lycium barbarum]XP_060181668.1 uncharacterized protein LOC132611265 [Lycium barbarum]